MRLVRTNSSNEDFRFLVTKLDALLTVLDGEDFSFFTQFNKLDSIREVVVAYIGDVPAGCGALKPFENGLAEVKRMYVDPEFRQKGIAFNILKELEHIAREAGFSGTILETGNKQQEAVALYKKSGYKVIPNYGQYANVEKSICMQKNWNDHQEK